MLFDGLTRTSRVQLSGCVFANNAAWGNGGAGYLNTFASLLVTSSSFINNYSDNDGNGGALYAVKGSSIKVESRWFRSFRLHFSQQFKALSSSLAG